jgi:predicted DNA-binding protein YlxM (UPF0122 family)
MFNTYDLTKPYDNQMGYSDDILDRFWSKVEFKYLENGEIDTNACMEWTAGTNYNSYGQFTIGKIHYLTHRFSFECFNGPVDFDLVVRHTCNNPLCLNPLHLKVGTQQENIDDMMAANRQSKNVESLTKKQVLEIKELLDQYVKIIVIAERYNVHFQTISNIRRGKYWSRITGIKKGDYEQNINHGILVKEQLLEIKNLFGLGVKSRIIAEQFDVSEGTISNIRRGNFWSNITGIKNGDYNNGSGGSKLTKFQAIDVKDMLEDKVSVDIIANKFGLDITSIYNIRAGKTYTEYTGIKPGDYSNKPGSLVKEQVIEVKKLLKNKVKGVEIARMFNVSKHVISKIKNGKTWSDVILVN